VAISSGFLTSNIRHFDGIVNNKVGSQVKGGNGGKAIDIHDIPCYAKLILGDRMGTMRFYLVRHGEAASKAIDPARSLTEKGHDDVARVAAFAQQAGVEVHQIYHSGKRRAEETAAILAGDLEPAGGLATVPGLRPDDDVTPMAEVLNQAAEPLMLVGHYPHLVRLAGLLLAGNKRSSAVDFPMGSIACLERNQGARSWSICWMVTPEIVPVC
jgi:phosphohistidine phosphatase